MQQFINTLFNPDVLDKLGSRVDLVAIVVAVLRSATLAEQQDLMNTLTARRSGRSRCRRSAETAGTRTPRR